MSRSLRYTCSMRGLCELDDEGRHVSLETCTRDCTAVAQRDLMTLVYQNNLADAINLAPSDREAVLFGLLGVRFPASKTRAILKGLSQLDVRPLLDYEMLINYVIRAYGPQPVRNALLHSGDLRALIYVSEPTLEERETFASSVLMTGNVQSLRELYRSGAHELLYSLNDVYLQPSISLKTLEVMFENDGEHLSFYLPMAIRQRLQNFLQAALSTGYTTNEEIEDGREGELRKSE